MSFKLIQTANVVSTTSEPNLSLATHVQKVLGGDLLEAIKPDKFQVNPTQYKKWLNAIVYIVNENGGNPNKAGEFKDVAFDLLDNDPYIDSLGSDTEKLKSHIITTLWNAYQAAKTHSAVEQEVSSKIKQAQEDEQASYNTSAQNPYPPKTLRSALWDDARKKEMAGQGVKDNGTKNPYPADTIRHAIWNKEHNIKSSEDEEIHVGVKEPIQNSIENRIKNLEDRLINVERSVPTEIDTNSIQAAEDEGAKAWLTCVDNLTKNPHSLDTKSHNAWNNGFARAASSHLNTN